MKSKILFIILGTFMITILAGCNSSLRNIEESIFSPTFSKTQTDIYKSFKKSLFNKNANLIYPKTGPNLLPIIISDINIDGNKDGIVFYSTEPDGYRKNININLLSQKDGNWISIQDISISALDIDKVFHININNKTFVIIGFIDFSLEKNFYIYEFNLNKLNFISSYKYEFLEIFDIDGDNKEDIIYSNNDNKGNIIVNLIKYDIERNLFSDISSLKIDPSLKFHINSTKGFSQRGDPTLILDFIGEDTSIYSQALYYEDDLLLNPIYLMGEKALKETKRFNRFFSKDIDLDGEVEIPSEIIVNGYDKEDHKLYFTIWKKHRDDGFHKVAQTYINTKFNYMVEFPEDWIDKITVKEESGDILGFYLYEDDLEKSTIPLVKIKTVLKSDDYSEFLDDGYIKISEHGRFRYLAKVFSHENYGITSLSIEEIIKLFKIYL